MKISSILNSIISALPALHPIREKAALHCRRNNSIFESVQLYPDAYLIVTECRSGEQYLTPLADTDTLDLAENVDAWIDREYCGEVKRTGEFQRWQGDFWAEIKTDGRSPDSPICWESGGFYVE
jgi:hypothetical protein